MIYLGVIIDKRLSFREQVDYIRLKKIDRKMNLLKVLNLLSDVNASILKNIYTASVKIMRHELQMLPLKHSAKLSRAKLYRKNRGNTKHPLHATINRRQRNGWTTEILECHRLASIQLEEPTQLQRRNTAPWEQLRYECRIDWTREGTEILKQRSLE